MEKKGAKEMMNNNQGMVAADTIDVLATAKRALAEALGLMEEATCMLHRDIGGNLEDAAAVEASFGHPVVASTWAALYAIADHPEVIKFNKVVAVLEGADDKR